MELTEFTNCSMNQIRSPKNIVKQILAGGVLATAGWSGEHQHITETEKINLNK